MREVDIGDRLLWPEEVAEVLGVPVGTLANWRYQRRAPAFVKVGRHVRYRELITRGDEYAEQGRFAQATQSYRQARRSSDLCSRRPHSSLEEPR